MILQIYDVKNVASIKLRDCDEEISIPVKSNNSKESKTPGDHCYDVTLWNPILLAISLQRV